MTTDAGLDAYPMGDEPEDNLRRMFADMKRVARARGYIDDVLHDVPALHILAIDLDRSAVVRSRGVRQKRLLVTQLHELIGSSIPETATFLDSGSRDEGWIVLPRGDVAEAARLADRLRRVTAGHDFRLADGLDVRLTASLGVVRSPLHGRTGQDLLWAAGEALWQAKQTRDAVYVAETAIPVEPMAFRVTVDQHARLASLAHRSGRSVDSLFHEALGLLLENHAPRWHWIVDMEGRTADAPAHRAESG